MTDIEIRDVVRAMLRDWERLSPAQRAQADAAARAACLDICVGCAGLGATIRHEYADIPLCAACHAEAQRRGASR